MAAASFIPVSLRGSVAADDETPPAPPRLPFLRTKENATAGAGGASNPARGWARCVADEDDRDAVSRVLAGEITAFDGIVRRWQGPLVSLAYRFTRDRGRAEDLAQDAFLRAYRGLHGYRGDAKFSTWLFALAVNLYRSEIRRVPPPSVSLDDVAEPAAPAPEHRENAVHAALHALPPKYRDVLLVYYFHEMDVATAARSLGLPEGTVKTRLTRGRDLLRQKLVSLSHPSPLEEAR